LIKKGEIVLGIENIFTNVFAKEEVLEVANLYSDYVMEVTANNDIPVTLNVFLDRFLVDYIEKTVDVYGIDESQLQHQMLITLKKYGYYKDNIHSVNERDYETLVESLSEFKMVEYGETEEEVKEDLYNLKNIDLYPIAYTTLGDNEELEIQVTLDLTNMVMLSNVTGNGVDITERYPFDNIFQVADLFATVDFETIVRLEEHDVDELVEQTVGV